MTTLSESPYKGERSFVLESERLRAEFVAQGARMVSLFDRGLACEFLLQQDKVSYLRSRFGQPMTPSQAVGYDDMFPTIDACHYEEFPWQGVQLPEHGEVWALDWNMVVQDSALTASVHGVRLPYRLTRRMSLPAANQQTLRLPVPPSREGRAGISLGPHFPPRSCGASLIRDPARPVPNSEAWECGY